MEPARTLTVRGIVPLLAHDNHNATNVNAAIQKLQPTYLTCYKGLLEELSLNIALRSEGRLSMQDYEDPACNMERPTTGAYIY
jgi:hypothetical protein